MKKPSAFQWINLIIFSILGGILLGVTQFRHASREAEKRERLEAEALATAEQLRKLSEEPDLPFAIEGTRWEAGGGDHWLLELDLRYRNENTKAVILEKPWVEVVTDEGDPIPEFFLAFAESPRVGSGEEEQVALRYWLTGSQRETGLWLEIGGDRLALPN
ncbi:MAG: hypothetical protein AAF191_06495 [Verrucomicrobiota bacterium]